MDHTNIINRIKYWPKYRLDRVRCVIVYLDTANSYSKFARIMSACPGRRETLHRILSRLRTLDYLKYQDINWRRTSKWLVLDSLSASERIGAILDDYLTLMLVQTAEGEP